MMEIVAAIFDCPSEMALRMTDCVFVVSTWLPRKI